MSFPDCCMVKTVLDACKGAIQDDAAMIALMRGGYSFTDIKAHLDPVLVQVRALRAAPPELALAA